MMKHVYFVNAHPDDLLTGQTEPEKCAEIRDREERKGCSYLDTLPV